ncbi:hypothetical protein [Methylomonas rivi]|uniref:Uncharacterized protein n=1 Tax=Methylomonas rivi TaxID=2952226 RepID=A0ABT1U3K8_9GAMM|nr:hypothetical protein [Methylomonas sp. WSC-6]MCQ8128423.1 hypothetical protein [Methylomonas sp. WSC-6]
MDIEKYDRCFWVFCDNSPPPKDLIRYWRKHIGIGGRQFIGTGGGFQSE